MAQKKVGFSNTSKVQADRLIINNGLTASINFDFQGGNNLTFNLPTADGPAGFAIITDGSGNLSFGTVSGNGTILGTGSSPKHAYWTGSQSLAASQMEEGTGQLLFPSGSVGTPGISFLLDGDTGMYRSGANKVAIAGGGSQIAEFSSTGIKIGQVTYTSFDGTSSHVLATDGNGNTYWVENVIGATGFDGATGPTGPAGTSGTSGADGTSGTSGQNGSSGTSGIGTNGTSGTSGNTGSSGTSGNNGSSGTSGQNGSSGTSGANGSSGTSGANGSSGTSGTFSGTFFETFITQGGTTASLLETESNWSGITYSGTALINTLQGQRHYSSSYIHEAVDDNIWIRSYLGGTALSLINGTATNPAIKFNTASQSGMYYTGDGISFVVGGSSVAQMRLDPGGYRVIQSKDGASTRPAYSFENDVDTGIYRLTTNKLGISTGGTRAANFGSTNSFANRTYFEKAVNHYPITATGVSGTYSLDYSEANVWNITLTGDTTLDYTNQYEGSYVLLVNQDSVGGRQLTFASGGKFIGATAVSLGTASNTKSIVQLIHIGTQSIVTFQTNLTNL